VSTAEITMYSTTWCPDCRRAQKVFKDAGVHYRSIDIEQDEAAAEEVERLNNGNRSVPTIVFPDGSRLVEPSNAELLRKLQSL
jgi:mycoredoxin